MLTLVVVREEVLSELRSQDRTPAWLAKRLGVDRAAVHRWLKGDQPIPAARRIEIALVLGKPRDWLSQPAEAAA